MNKLIVLVAGTLAATTLFAAPARAQNPSEIEIIGNAEAFCTLPSSWEYQSSTNNVSSSQFSNNVWTIPQALVSNTDGQAINDTAEVAIRVRGSGSCNTSHTITLQSSNGGLAHIGSNTNPPPGFTRTRRMEYGAHWVGSGIESNWGVFNWVPAAPGASITYDHGPKPPPGNRPFDIRMEVLRDFTQSPMLAGGYSDQLTVTISPAS